MLQTYLEAHDSFTLFQYFGESYNQCLNYPGNQGGLIPANSSGIELVE